MRVLVTGGTGFVGGHAVARLVRDGHEVRLLVRRAEQVPLTLGPLEVPTDAVDVVVGDVLDPAAVDRALDGCDAVVHAAAIYSLDARRAQEMQRTNAQAAELVLGRAVELGLDPVVHVSSTVALTRYDGSGPDLPLGDVDLPYSRSKLVSEQIARRLQEEGAPVVSVYPGSVLGPHDPYRGDQSERLRWVAAGRLPVWPKGGLQYVDARTVADTIAALLQPGQGPRRYVVPGTHVSDGALFDVVQRVTGRRRPHLLMSPPVARGSVRLIEAVQRRLPSRWHMPADREGVEISIRNTRFDDGPARRDLGVEPVPFEDSVRDTLVWLVRSGRLPAKHAGTAV